MFTALFISLLLVSQQQIHKDHFRWGHWKLHHCFFFFSYTVFHKLWRYGAKWSQMGKEMVFLLSTHFSFFHTSVTKTNNFLKKYHQVTTTASKYENSLSYEIWHKNDWIQVWNWIILPSKIRNQFMLKLRINIRLWFRKLLVLKGQTT